MSVSHVSIAVAVALSAALVAGCSEAPLSYQADIRPIMEKHCDGCHLVGGEGYEASGFATGSYEDLMKGTKFGPVIDPGSAISSSLYLMVAGKTDPSIRMPHGDATLSKDEVAAIEKWIDQGAKNN
jgi:hypothetical protein